MKSLLLVTDSNQQRTQFQHLYEDLYTFFTAASVSDALDLLRLTQVDVVAVALEDAAVPVQEFFDQAKTYHPHCVTLYLLPPLPEEIIGDERALPPSDFALRRPCSRDALRQVIAQAMEKQRLLEEVASLRGQNVTREPILGAAAPVPMLHGSELSLARIGQVLRDFAKTFSTNFDLQSSLTLFLDAINAFLRPSRVSIMVRHPHSRTFEIRAHQGLVPQVAKQLRLREEEGLPLWLLTEARIIQRYEVEKALHNPVFLEIHREMQALKAVASLPLMVSGKLVGILNLGDRVSGLPYSDDELDILFSLASNVAISIQDIGLYHQVQSQKAFTEKILRYMSSGVLTIDDHETIRMCNHRAANILGKNWADVVHGDLRSLPSPLGDMFYETLQDGVSYDKREVTITAAKVPLEVSTYQILDDQLNVSGSVMVFDDLTSQKQLYEERRRAHQFDYLNKVASRMAFEIKNPLVSIQTFIELLDEHYDDAEFRNQFSRVVSQDIHTINVITEKLVSLASDIAYQFEPGDVNNLLHALESTLNFERRPTLTGDSDDAVVDLVDIRESSGIELACQEGLPVVRFDAEQLYKALMYIVAYLSQNTNSSKKILVVSRYRQPKADAYRGDRILISLTGKNAKVDDEELEKLFDPFDAEHHTLVDIGPSVSQKIIEEHGGSLDFHLEKKGELTFEVTLPVGV